MKALIALLALLTVLPATLHARTIDWGNSAFDGLYNSSGSALDDSYIFELGSFGNFIPTELNLDDWLANWKVFDRAEAPSTSGWNSAFSAFSSSATLEAGGASSEFPLNTFAASEQAYIWVYNTQTMAYGVTEWALITNSSLDGNTTNDWVFPAPGGKETDSLEWRVSPAQGLVYGGLNDVEGPGGYTSTPAGLTIQTHSVIPEPSALLLVLSAGALIRFRRRRR